MPDLNAWPVWANMLVVLATIVVVARGAHWVVDSASAMAGRLGISQLMIGLTVVAFGTSAPEFAVTLIAAFKGHGNISVGNIVGSNTFNLGFILGLCALVHPVPADNDLVRRDGVVLALAAFALLALVGLDLRLDRVDGVVLFGLLLAYLIFLVRTRKAPDGGDPADSDEAPGPLWRQVLALVLGLACIVGGSHMLVQAASAMARTFGISEWTIAVTIVAAGTSAPEFATSLVGVLRRRYDISLGNLVGSDIFNLLGVLGLAGMLQPVEVTPVARLSLVALTTMVLLVLLAMRTGWRISRMEGLALVALAAVRWVIDASAGQVP